MAYCPICHRDFEEGITYCSFCEEALVDSLDEHVDAPPHEFSADGEVIYTAFSPRQAGEIETLLANHHIPCVIHPSDDDEEAIFVPGQDPSLSLDIVVPTEYVGEALQYLETFLGVDAETEEEDDYGEEQYDDEADIEEISDE